MAIGRFFNKFIWFAKNFRQIKPTAALFCNVHEKVTYNTDGLATSNNCDFMQEERFKKAYIAAAATKPWDNFTLQWRVHVVCWLANHVKGLPGDFVECGVNTGAYAKAIIEYINFNATGKRFYLLDTFEGLDKQQITETEYQAGIGNYLQAYTNVYEQVQATFKDDNVVIVKGLVPATLAQIKSEQIAFLSIDMNVVAPEIAAIEYLWGRIVPGGVLVHDDYGFPAHIHQKNAVDAFAKQHGLDILCLPTGQAVIFKQ